MIRSRYFDDVLRRSFGFPDVTDGTRPPTRCARPVGKPFENKVALVTGAGSGMGLAAAQASAVEGAAAVLVDINESAVRAAAARLVATGHKAIAIRCDVTDEAQVKAMIEQSWDSSNGRPTKCPPAPPPTENKYST